MIISSLYGPQFDPTDGTIGTLQCVKRWVLVKGDGNTFYPRQGRHTKATKDEAEALVKAAIKNNGPGTSGHPYVQGLHAEEWWCYPRHFDPIRPVQPEGTEGQDRKSYSDNQDRKSYTVDPSL